MKKVNTLKRTLQQTSLNCFVQDSQKHLKKDGDISSFGSKAGGEMKSFHNHGMFLSGLYPDASILKPTQKTPIKIASFDMDWTIIRTQGG
jgi:hypothetical protein